jgi:hypothetical protein
VQRKIITGVVVSYKDDALLNICYLSFLTSTSVIKLKIPQSFSKYKYKHLLEPNRINKIEIVKTSKNWILTQVIFSQVYSTFTSYKDCLDFTGVIKELSSSLRENEQTGVLKILLSCVDEKLQKLNTQKFASLFSNYQGQVNI